MTRKMDRTRRADWRTLVMTCLFLMLAWGVGGCERARALFEGSAEPDGAPADAVEFVVDADGVFYGTLMANGQLIGANRLGRVPLAERAAVVVHVRGETVELDDRYYVADLIDVRPGDTVTAQLLGAESIAERLVAGEQAAHGALAVRDQARAMLDVGPDEKPASEGFAIRRSSGKDVSPKDQRRRPGKRLEMEEREAIEIFDDGELTSASDTVKTSSADGDGIVIRRINDAAGSGSSDSSRPITPGSKWKPITLYYADWCGVCKKAQRWLDANDVPYRGVDVDASEENSREMDRFCRSKNVPDNAIPTLRIGDQVMQGWSSGRFEQMARR
jgi:glutaredoxin